MAKLPRDAARHDLLAVADALEAQGSAPAYERIATARALGIAVKVLRAVADGENPHELIDGRRQEFARLRAVSEVENAASNVLNLSAAYEAAAIVIGCDASTIAKHWRAYWRERQMEPVLTFKDSDESQGANS